MKLLKYVAILVVALLVAVGAAFFLIPTERLVAVVTDEVRDATGRELAITGDISPSIYPVLGVTISNATLSNAAWAQDENMATVGAATVGVRVGPLLSGRVEVEEIRLVDAIVALEIAEDGRPNWALEGDAPAKRPADGTGQNGTTSDSDSGTPARLTDRGDSSGGELDRLGRVRLVLENAAVTYNNHVTGVALATRELSLTAMLDNPDAPLSVEGSGVFNDHNAKLSLTLDTPAKLIRGAEAMTDLSVDFDGASLSYSGALSAAINGGAPSANGAVSASVPDIPRLVAALGAEPPKTPKGVLESASLDGQLAFDGVSAELSGLALSVDGQTVSGDASIDPSGARPFIRAALMADDLDLRPYLSERPSKGAAARQRAGDEQDGKKDRRKGKKKKRGAKGWSKTPIDLSGLNTVDADVSIRAQSVLLEQGEIRDADIRAMLKDGVLDLKINKLNMFDGGASGEIRLNGKGVPKVAADLDVDSMQLLAILSTLADFDKLEGVGAVSLDVRGKGKSLHGIMNNLRGDSSIKLTDGAILGVNLAAMVRNATGAFAQNSNEAQKTDFAEISASFDIKKGVARNTDLIFLGPLLRANGAGAIDIGARTLNYKVTPRAVASLKGQGGDAGLAGISVPVIISGPWSKPKYEPDLSGALENVLSDPDAAQDAEELLRDLDSNIGDALKGLLGR